MDTTDTDSIMIPYSAVVGQSRMKQALEIAYVQPSISGVLLTGERGTAKSTLVRAFATTFCSKPMVTLPINATEDRVVGGWNIDKLTRDGGFEKVPGLLEEANKTILYIDEANLLDDHIVNILLDVAASGILVVEHEHLRRNVPVRFTMVGTMNPEEGELRSQLLDRFDLYVDVHAQVEDREAILHRMIELDSARHAIANGRAPSLLTKLRREDARRLKTLKRARELCPRVKFGEHVLAACAELASQLQSSGHRGERVLALAIQAQAAIDGEKMAGLHQLRSLAPMAFQHRSQLVEAERGQWGDLHEKIIDEVVGEVTEETA